MQLTEHPSMDIDGSTLVDPKNEACLESNGSHDFMVFNMTSHMIRSTPFIHALIKPVNPINHVRLQ